MKTLSALLSELTYDDLDQWAGEKIRARGKAYLGRVDGLHRTAKDELVAWVSGTEDYATLVHLDEGGEHDWFCTCPYDGGPCKHAVAVILAAVRQVRNKRDIPLLSEDDDLHLVLFSGQDDESAPEDEEPEYGRPEAGEKGSKREHAKVRKLLADKSREELLDMVVRLAADFPAVERALLEAEHLKSGRIEPVVRALRREIGHLTDEPAWSSPWSDERDIPDFSHVRQQFATLLAAGHADALLELGDELWRRGTEQVEQSDDEGETGEAIAGCMDIVLRALPCSSLPRATQLLWVIDRLLEDQYGLLQSGEQVLADAVYGPEDWRQVAAALERRVDTAKKGPRPATFTDSFRAAELQDRLVAAYRRSGQTEKIVPLMERDVERLGNYGRLADLLVEAGDPERARQWCIQGFDRTVREKAGTAEGLQERLRRIAETRQQHELVAAHRAEEFFHRPWLESYKELRRAAERLGCWPPVRAGALGYLESGRRPDAPAKKGEPVSWPLPAPEVRYAQEKPRSGGRDRFPERSVLIDIAIFEKRFDDVVALYQAMAKGSFGTTGIDETVAKAVAKTHPEVALAIWRRLADGLIAQVKPKSYVEAGGFLRLMHKVFRERQRLAEWEALLAELRRTHKAKRRLLEVLDTVGGDGRKIIDGMKGGES
ncbi:SWIM zinc finger family protein [Desulfobulbus elongatus]|uniref:SWIM zinc finger family protein n=1 Tax=Desulfobulbus elongatus TaxID=53332 RepID=UPI000482821A|nr:SWIM zinc finger family protein [Desulfobulbus elongatus]